MKRISILLAICLLLGIPAQAAAPAVFRYQSSRLGFSVTVSGIRQGEVIAEETDTGVNFYHAPSREKYGGEIGSVVVVSHGLISSPATTMIWRTRSSPWERTRYFYGRRQEEALPPAEIFWMPFDGYPPPLPGRVCGKVWFRLSLMDGRSSKQRGIWHTCQ